MPRMKGWRRRVLPALLGAALLLVPIVVGAHVHPSDTAASTSCLLCAVADHGASDVPIVARAAAPPPLELDAIRPVPGRIGDPPLTASSSRGPPLPLAPSSD